MSDKEWVSAFRILNRSPTYYLKIDKSPKGTYEALLMTDESEAILATKFM